MQNPSDYRAPSRSMAVSGSREPSAGIYRIHAARCAGGAVDGAVHDDADVARLSLALRLLRHSHVQRGQVALAKRTARGGGVQASSGARLWLRLFRRRPFPVAAEAHRGDLQRDQDASVTIQWGCEGRVDSVAQHLFPTMAKAHCRTIMFGVESGSQKVLDRLQKEQTLAEIETAVTNAKKAGVEIVHGFFVVGSPEETVEDMRATFDFASKLPLDTFAFNRLCVYRGTPLWQEYVKRGLVDDAVDWYKYFKCSEIDPTCFQARSSMQNVGQGSGGSSSISFCTFPFKPSDSCAGSSAICRSAMSSISLPSRSWEEERDRRRRRSCLAQWSMAPSRMRPLR